MKRAMQGMPGNGMADRRETDMEKKNGNFQQRNKDAGFSLVELLIAVIILAIIVVPMLHGFVTSARMNGKAKQVQRATTVAQDIMEGLKAYDIEELQAQFNEPADGFYVIDARLIHGSIKEDYFEKSVTGNEDEDIEYRHVPKDEVPPGIYYFTMEGVQLQGSEYDALIRIDAVGYEKDAHGNPPANHDNAFNNADITSPSSIIKGKTGKDGIYVQSAGQDLSAAEAVKKAWDLEDSEDELAGKPFTFRTFADQGGKVTRTITLSMENDGVDAEGNRCCKVSVQYAYDCTYNGAPCPVQITGDFPTGAVPCGEKIPEGGNIYLFYYPLYAERGTAAGSPGALPENKIRDNIVINNKTGLPFTIYIVKQVDSVTAASLPEQQLKIAEEKYAPVVKGTGTAELTIRTNLGTNLVGPAFGSSGGSSPNDGKLATDQDKMEDQMIPVAGQKTGIIGFKKVLGLSQMEDDKITEVIYDVEICIYKAGAGKKDFEDCRPMIVIKGSKNN